ncbi:MAG: class E sortase [Actinobacteria bacterium]|nr:MAG: class E sortase [Actinomycetota bacterium]
MERIDTRSKTTRKAVLLALALAAVAIFFHASPGRPTAQASLPPTTEAAKAIPEDKGLWLTVPKMARVEDLPVVTGPANDEAALAQSALHVAGTGLPWQEEANVYIAGHRIGFEGEASHLVFYDLDALENGDEVILTDANGTRYTYTVFRSFVVGPSDTHVMGPVAGKKNVVSLQTCTPIPTFKERLVVQAELTEVAPA